MILTSYQQQQALQEQTQGLGRIGVVDTLYPDGASVRLDGEAAPGAKHYLYNRTLSLRRGDRVFLLPSGDSYVIAFPI